MKKSPAILSIVAGYKLKKPPRKGAAGEYALLEDIIRNHSSDFPDVCASLKLKRCDITIGECQNKFAIRDDFGKAWGLHGEKLHFRIGHRAEGLALSCNPLYINRYDSLVSKNQLVAYGLKCGSDFFPVNQQAIHFTTHIGNGNRL